MFSSEHFAFGRLIAVEGGAFTAFTAQHLMATEVSGEILINKHFSPQVTEIHYSFPVCVELKLVYAFH